MIQSVRNAVKVLNCFSQESLELSLTEIARQLQMNKSTVHHIIKTLRNEGVLVKTENNLYALGKKLFEWGSLVNARNQLVPLSIPYIHELVNQTSEVVHLGVLDHDQVLYIAKSEIPASMRIETKIGGRRPANCTAIGKVLLANESEVDINRLIDQGLSSMTRHSINDGTKLLEEIKRVKEIGIADDREEYAEGVECIATQLTDAAGDCIAAISVCGPKHRIRSNYNLYSKHLTKTARFISKAIYEAHMQQLKIRNNR